MGFEKASKCKCKCKCKCGSVLHFIFILGWRSLTGMANMHNAKRALSPMINIIGEMSTWHRSADALLAMDIEKVASAVSGLVKTCNRPDRVVQVQLMLQKHRL